MMEKSQQKSHVTTQSVVDCISIGGQGCIQKFCQGGGAKLRYGKKRGRRPDLVSREIHVLVQYFFPQILEMEGGQMPCPP